MTRDEFIINFFNTDNSPAPHVWDKINTPVSIFGVEYALVGMIYDLQIQVKQQGDVIEKLIESLLEEINE